MLQVFQSNRIEVLASAAARVMREAPLPPLEAETVVVPSSGLGRWLGFVLARELGAAANLKTEFAAGFIWTLVRRLVPGLPEQSLLEPEVLRWRIADLLARPHRGREFARVNHYLEGADVDKRFDLASAVAEAFDRYLVYRPDWIETWSRGKRENLGPDEGWQAALWKSIAEGLPDAMRIDPRRKFFETLASDEGARSKLPRRVLLFALTSLPPAYFDFFQRLAEAGGVDVRLYAHNPSREYWGDIVRRRELARAHAARPDEAALLDVGNGLLASLGWQGRALFDALADIDAAGDEMFHSPGHATLLASLQSDILDLKETPGTLAADDDSLRVHACHSATREVEVLHDRLLDLFARDAALRPSDILVLAPQLDTYAPAIEAVFAAAPARRRIPFAIADRPPEAESEIARAFRQLLALSRSRLDAEGVLALLEVRAVGLRFGISSQELPTARQWLRETGVRWGRDERAREALGLPATREHSWRAGFERLFLGYALAGDHEALFSGVLPYEDIEGGAAVLAGRLKTFADAVFALVDDLQRPRPAAAWRDRLDRVLADFFAPGEDEARDRLEIREALAQIASQAARGGNDEDVPLAVIERELVAVTAAQLRPHAFLGGGVTFASLSPGRPVPARVIAFLGMNDGAFPRLQRVPGFDLVRTHARKGDRDRRDDDRYAFLEALLSARERLYISFTGRSIRDNEEIPPSTLVSELLEAVRRSFGEAAAKAVLVEHPLQPFSRKYFDGSAPELFSYADSYTQGSRGTADPAPFLRGPLAGAGEPGRMPVALDELARFMRDPAKALLHDRLGVRLAESEGVLDATEPFDLGPLELSAVQRNAFAALVAGVAPDAAFAIERARGTLPQGEAGRTLFAKVVSEVEPLARKAGSAGEPETIIIDREIGSERLVGGVRVGPVFYPGKLNARRRIALWVRHLAAQLAGGPHETAVHGLDASIVFVPVHEAEMRLTELLALYRRGQSTLVPFFPKTSLAYAERAAEDEEAALRDARRAWEGDDYGKVRAERDEDYAALAWRGIGDPLDDSFRSLAVEILGPMIAATQKGGA